MVRLDGGPIGGAMWILGGVFAMCAGRSIVSGLTPLSMGVDLLERDEGIRTRPQRIFAYVAGVALVLWGAAFVLWDVPGAREVISSWIAFWLE